MSSSNNMQTFKPEQLQERITETVRTNFGMLIPDDQFQALVQREIQAYFDEATEVNWVTERSDNRGYFSNNDLLKIKLKMTPFRFQVWSEIRKLMDSKIEMLFNTELSATTTQVCDNYGNQTMEAYLSDRMEKMLQKLAPKMAEQMFSVMFVDAVNAVKADLKNELANSMQQGI